MTRVAVYGCKTIAEAVARPLLDLELSALRPHVAALWYGGGTTRGTDLAALAWAAAQLVTASSTASDWQRWGARRAGMIRGDNAARWAEVVVLLWDPHAPEADGTLAGLVNGAITHDRRVIMQIVGADPGRLDTAADPADVGRVIDTVRAPRVPRPRPARRPAA